MKMFKSRKLRVFLVALVTILVFLLVISFIQDYQFSKKSEFVKIEELISNSTKYNNKQICTTGYYSSNWESASLSTAKDKTGSIWISYGIEIEKTPLNFIPLVFNNFNVHKTEANVCGIFQVTNTIKGYISGFGSMGAYKYRITTNPNEDF